MMHEQLAAINRFDNQRNVSHHMYVVTGHSTVEVATSQHEHHFTSTDIGQIIR